ncbi:MAG: hypothetical protein RR651_09035 [Lysinibacillus sp.]
MKTIRGLLVAIISVFIFFSIFVIVNLLRYPELPIDSVSPKEAIEKIKESDRDLVEISKDSDATWYIAEREKGISAVDENIKKFISNEGWVFKIKEGSGLIFEKNGETLIVTTEVWKDYYLIRKPVIK